MKRLFETYFPLPFKLDQYGSGYAFDATGGQMVLQFSDAIKESVATEIVECINGKDNTEYPDCGADYLEDQIFMNGTFLCDIRGWGHLTGRGALNLSPVTAVEIQTDLADYIIERLTYKP